MLLFPTKDHTQFQNELMYDTDFKLANPDDFSKSVELWKSYAKSFVCTKVCKYQYMKLSTEVEQ